VTSVKKLLSYFCIGLFLIAFGNGQTIEISTLAIDIPVEREISNDEVHRYKITAQTDDFVRLVVLQQNADITLRVIAPDGKSLPVTENFTERNESERFSFIAETAGEYQIEIKYNAALRGRSPGKSYLLRLEALRPPSEKDRRQINAEKLYDQAALLGSKNEAESRRASLPIFLESLTHFQAAEDRAGEAQTFYALGIIHSLLSEFAPGQENSARAAQIFRRLDMKPQLANTFIQQSAMSLFVGDNAKAEEMSLAALDIFRQLGDRRGEAEIIGNLGVLANRKNEPRRALEYFEQALPILRAEKDSEQEARMLRSIGLTYNNLGEPFKAVESLEKALAISRADNELLGVSTALISLGVMSRTVGEVQKAIDQLNEALELVRKLGNRRNEAVCLNNLGSHYEHLGETSAARDYYEKSLALSRELKMRDYEVNSLNGISSLELKSGNLPKALEVSTQALQIARETGNKRHASRMLARIGETRLKLGEREKAFESLNQALTIQREIGDREAEAVTLFLLGKAHRQNGDLKAARETCALALQIAQEMKTPPLQAEIFGETANIEKDAKNLAAAQANIEKAIEIAESTRSKFSRQDFRATYFSAQQNFYEFYVDALAAQGKNAEAWRASERARARSLLESLGESQAGIRAGIAPELLAKENVLRRTINAKETQRLNAAAQKNPSKAAAFEKEIAEAVEKYRDLQTEIRRQSPQFAALTDPEPLDLADVQAQVLDEDTILLEYALGAERSFLFAVTVNTLDVYELPKREMIEKSARRAIEKIKLSDAAAKTDLNDLSQILLAPVAEKLPNKRLLIVAPGVLQYVPFAALSSPKSKVQSPKSDETDSGLRTQDSGFFLIETNEIVNLPSASVLALLRQNKTRPAYPKNTVAILADPVFTDDDVRLKLLAKQKTEPDSVNGATSVMREAKLFPPQMRSGFGRLRFSRLEADAISALAQKNRKFVAMDFAANLKAATGEEFQKSGIVHLATHGIINSDYPELSGVVLSLIDENGKPQDGFLRLHDIYNLRLDANLVVLSACETALGKEIKGEGIVGLTRGFMYAGAPTVVASLWKVDDRATADLMKRFYQRMLKNNLRPADALRQAQISMLKEKPTQNPFYWAAFTVQGEYK
jgi:CHAT domain-containing protein